MQVEAAAPCIVATLQQKGIRSVITKGPGIARTYPAVGLRPFRDIDILVEPTRFGEAVSVLGSVGFNEPSELMRPRAYYYTRCLEAVTLVRNDGIAVDLHHHIPPWIWGRGLPANRVIERAITLDVGS